MHIYVEIQYFLMHIYVEIQYFLIHIYVEIQYLFCRKLKESLCTSPCKDLSDRAKNAIGDARFQRSHHNK